MRLVGTLLCRHGADRDGLELRAGVVFRQPVTPHVALGRMRIDVDEGAYPWRFTIFDQFSFQSLLVTDSTEVVRIRSSESSALIFSSGSGRLK